MSRQREELRIFEIFQDAWDALMQRPWLAIGGWLVVLLLTMPLQLPSLFEMQITLSNKWGGTSGDNPLPLFLSQHSTLLEYLNMFLQIWLGAGLALLFTRIAKGEPAKLTDIFGGDRLSLPWLLKVFAAMIFYYLSIWLGLLCLIIPGIVVFLIWSLTLYFIVDQDRGIIDAFSASFEATEGNRFKLFLLFLVMTAVYAIALILTCGFGLLILEPWRQMVWAKIYLTLAYDDGSDEEFEAQTAPPAMPFRETAAPAATPTLIPLAPLDEPERQASDPAATSSSPVYKVSHFVIFDRDSRVNEPLAKAFCENWLSKHLTARTTSSTTVRLEHNASGVLDNPGFKHSYPGEQFPDQNYIWEAISFEGVDYWLLIVFAP